MIFHYANLLCRPIVALLSLLILLALFRPPAVEAADKFVFTEPGLEFTTSPAGAKVGVIIVGHSCSEKAPIMVKEVTLEYVTPYINSKDYLPRFQGSKRKPKRCITYRFVVSRMNFRTIEEEIDGRSLEVAKKNWILEPSNSIDETASVAPLAVVSINAEWNGEPILESHYRYNEIQLSVLTFLAELAQRGVLSDYQPHLIHRSPRKGLPGG